MNNAEKKRITRELEEYLTQADTVEEFLDVHKGNMVCEKPGRYLNSLIDRTNVNKGTLLKKINLSKSFFYEVLGGKKLPGRNNFIQFMIALDQPFSECQAALKACGYNPLYARNRRDAIIIYCIENQKCLAEVNILLESQNMTILYQLNCSFMVFIDLCSVEHPRHHTVCADNAVRPTIIFAANGTRHGCWILT